MVSRVTGVPDLERSAIGLPRILFQSVAMMAPAAALAFSLSVGIPFAGVTMPLSVIFAFVGCLLVAVPISMLAKIFPSAGSLFTFIRGGSNSKVGAVFGGVMGLYLLLFVPLGFLLIPVVLQPVFSADLHFTIGWWPWAVIVAILIAAVSYYGLRLSASVALLMAAFEILVFLALAIWMLSKNGDQIGAAPFVPKNAPDGSIAGVMKGAIYGILAFTGFEGAAAYGSEGRNPRRSIPVAVFLATIAIGAFYFFGMFAAVYGAGLKGFLPLIAHSSDPWVTLARHFWGVGWVLIFLAIINSLFATTLAGASIGGRVLYSLGRSGLLPRQVSAVHARHRTPHVAILTDCALGLALALIAGTVWGPYPAFETVATAVTLFAIMAYIATSIVAVIFYSRRRRDEFKWYYHGLLPILGAAVFAVALYYQFSPLPPAPIVYANWFALASFVVLAGTVAVLWATKRWPAAEDFDLDVAIDDAPVADMSAVGVESAPSASSAGGSGISGVRGRPGTD